MSNLVRNCWYVAGWSTDFTDKPVQRMLIGDAVVLYRKLDGGIVVLEDRCAHRMAPLSLGTVEGDSIRCLYHSIKFSPEGKCEEIPSQDKIPDSFCVKRYPAVEKSGWVWVWMGDPDRADPSRIANAKALDDSQWVLKTGQMDYQANYELINDNLLDLAHLSSVHADSFGADAAWSLTRAKVEPIPEGVRISRWLENTAPVPPLGDAAGHAKVDMWTSCDFVLPGVFLFYAGSFPLGSAQASHGGEPSIPSLFASFTSQAVTPTTERTSTYYYSWGPQAGQGDEAVAQIMIDVANGAFTEDRTVIEAQQKIIDLNPAIRPKPTAGDKAITLFQRLMQSQDQAKPNVERTLEEHVS